MRGLSSRSALTALRTVRPGDAGRNQTRRAFFSPWREHTHPYVLEERLFRDAVIRQIRRTDRFEEAFLLARVTFADRDAPARAVERAVRALSRASLDTDIVGWIKRGSELGLIRPVEDPATASRADVIVAAVRDVLVRGLIEDGATCSIHLEVHRPLRTLASTRPLDAAWRQRSGRARVYETLKRALDIVGSLVCLTVLLPVIALIALLIKTTSNGPVLFRQERIGRSGRPFTMLKFRTMSANADPAMHRQYVERFIQSSAEPSDDTVIRKVVDDPRVLRRIGRFLRRSSLDEIPQFWNVLVGEMSLVGPRPPVPYEVAKYKSWHLHRVLDAKPGMTGLWQVTGRSQTTFDEMVRLDLRYARHRSLWGDIKILLATPRAVLSGRGAY
jgi:lipopolysaccharide/colanic/teichoic acid biosynthesis glycosyltransferase